MELRIIITERGFDRTQIYGNREDHEKAMKIYQLIYPHIEAIEHTLEEKRKTEKEAE